MKTYTMNNLIKKYGKAFLVVIIFALIGGVSMGVVAKKKKQTSYMASTQVLISHDLSSTNYSSVNTNNSITNDDNNMMTTYKDIVSDGIVTNKARKYLPKSIKSKYNSSDIQGTISAKVFPQSLVMSIRAKTSSPKDSVAIVNATAKALKTQLPKIQPGAGQVTLLQKASEQDVKSETHPSTKKYVVVGIALGGLLGLIIIFLVITVKNFGKKE